MSKTKTLAAIALTAAIAGSAFAFSGCCKHGHESKSVAATCTEAGYYEDVCFKCGNVNERYETSPALGHSYDGGFCSRCGEPDPSDTTLSDKAEKLNLSADGTLSWNKLKTATKYELSLTLPGETEAKVYEIPKNQGVLKLDEFFGNDDYGEKIEFPAGRTFAKFMHYEMYTEEIEGEKIEQEFPVEEQADEFRIIKRNGSFEIVRMGYKDENVALNGFYAQPREDENGKYYLYEVVMEDNSKPQKFNVSSFVKPTSGNKAAYYRSADDRGKGQNAISSFDMPYQTIPAGANTYYMRLTLAGGGYKDYDLRVYGLKTLEVKKYTLESGVRREAGSTTCMEGDIIPCDELFSGFPRYESYVVRDEAYNYIGKASGQSSGVDHKYVGDADYTVAACGSGNSVALYFYKNGDEAAVKEQCAEYAKWAKVYLIGEVWEPYAGSDEKLNGYTLNYLNASSATEAVIPAEINGKGIISADFSYGLLSTLTIERMYSLPQLTLVYSNITTINLGYVNVMHEGAFVGANGNLVINCDFGESTAQYFPAKWNYKNPQNQYSTEKFTTNYNA